MPSAGIHHGHEGVERFFREWLGAWDGLQDGGPRIHRCWRPGRIVFRQGGLDGAAALEASATSLASMGAARAALSTSTCGVSMKPPLPGTVVSPVPVVVGGCRGRVVSARSSFPPQAATLSTTPINVTRMFRRTAPVPAGSGVGVSVLLRQPQGFEGLGVIPEVLDHHDLALAKRLDVRDVDFASRPRPAPRHRYLAITRSPASIKC